MPDLLTFAIRLQETLAEEHTQAPLLFREITQMERVLSDTYRERVAYELLQNSDDAGATKVAIRILENGFTWQNNGRVFTKSDLEALCRSAVSNKVGSSQIGYRGIGFKSLACVASRISIRTGDLAFAFDRGSTRQLLKKKGVLESEDLTEDEVPLIRIPTSLQTVSRFNGASFHVETIAPPAFDFIEPLALLFLRNIREVQLQGPGTKQAFIRSDHRNETRITTPSGTAIFIVERFKTATIAIPTNELAKHLVGRSGALYCYLPLNDPLGLPLIASGSLLTDPSRTHAVVEDDSTVSVFRDLSTFLADHLVDPQSSYFDLLWEVLASAPDVRIALLNYENTVEKVFADTFSKEIRSRNIPFSFSPIGLDDATAHKLYGSNYPKALLTHNSELWAIRTALGGEELPLSKLARIANGGGVNATLQEELVKQLESKRATHGSLLSEEETTFLASRGSNEEPRQVTRLHIKPTDPDSPGQKPFRSVIRQWRSAELAVLEWLNGEGWSLRDVSSQNLGYDLTGVDPAGSTVHVEVKKVRGPSDRLSVTNNEMALIQDSPFRYLLAVVTLNESRSSLMLVDPLHEEIRRVRVCRQWEWEFSNWSATGKWFS